ncbi:hypothetical protein Hanom_Chr15g01388351 [Helianthus anomalus]
MDYRPEPKMSMDLVHVWLSCRKGNSRFRRGHIRCQARFFVRVRRVAVTRIKKTSFRFLSHDVAPPGWLLSFLLTVHYPIAFNTMGINIRRLRRFLHFFPNFFFKVSLVFIIFSLPFFSKSTIISTNISTSSKPRVSKKRQSKPKDPPGPNRAVIIWKEK